LYFLFLLLIIVFYYLYSCKLRIFHSFSFSFIISLLYSSRNINIGNDTKGYLIAYKYYNSSIILNVSNFEFGYNILQLISPNFYVLLFLVSFFTFFLISITAVDKYHWGSIFLILLLSLFFNVATDQMRQILSISIFTFLYQSLVSKYKLFYSILLSISFHLSSFIFIIHEFTTRQNKKLLIIIFIISLYFALYNIWPLIFINFLNFYPLVNKIYFNSKFYNFLDNQTYNILLYRFIFICYLLFCYKPHNINISYYNLFIIALCLQLSSNNFMPIERIANSLYYFSLILLAKNELNILNFNLSSFSISRITVYFILFFQFILAILFNLEKHGSVPWNI
jgi:hypothetical protein